MKDLAFAPQQFSFEVRFISPQNQLWEIAPKIFNKISDLNLVPAPVIAGQPIELTGYGKPRTANIGPLNFIYSSVQITVQEFIKEVRLYGEAVCDALGVKEFTRIGLRSTWLWESSELSILGQFLKEGFLRGLYLGKNPIKISGLQIQTELADFTARYNLGLVARQTISASFPVDGVGGAAEGTVGYALSADIDLFEGSKVYSASDVEQFLESFNGNIQELTDSLKGGLLSTPAE